MKDQNFLIENGIDLQTSLELFGDIEMYNESLGDFMIEIDGKLAKLKNSKEISDMDNYAVVVHSLKSDAKYFGFTNLAEMAFQHEVQSKAKNALYVKDNYDALIEEANKIIDIVKEYLGRDTSTTEGEVRTPIEPAMPKEAQPTNDNSQTILIVDDSDIIKNFIQKKFETKYKVLTAADGEEAINEIKNNLNIAAMLLDLNMPNVNGFEVLDYMRSQDLFKHIPVSVITGNDNKEIDDKAFEYPIVDILKKPFSEGLIANIIEKTINSKHY